MPKVVVCIVCEEPAKVRITDLTTGGTWALCEQHFKHQFDSETVSPTPLRRDTAVSPGGS
jgi:hypothetical protein